MLGHVSGSTTVLTAQCQTLQHAQRDQNDGSRGADGGIGRQQADDEGRQAHDEDGHQEGVFATDHVTQAAEHQRAEGAHDETGSEGQQREDECRAGIQSREELLGNDRGQRAVKVKVVPLEHGAEGRGENHFSFLAAHRPGCSCSHGFVS